MAADRASPIVGWKAEQPPKHKPVVLLIGRLRPNEKSLHHLLTRRGVSSYHVRPDGAVAPLSPRPIRAGFRPLGMVYVQK